MKKIKAFEKLEFYDDFMFGRVIIKSCGLLKEA